MNIHIYYQDKSIHLYQSKQSTHNQDVKDLDQLHSKELNEMFKNFIQKIDEKVLQFKTKNIEASLQKFQKAFKYIEAAGGLIRQEDKVLWIYRLKKWDLPKGKIDSGETPEQAAIRECEEECSIGRLIVENFLCHTYHIYDYKGDFAFKKTYWYDMVSADKNILKPQVEEHIEKVEWMPVDKIKKVVLPNTYPTIKEVLKIKGII